MARGDTFIDDEGREYIDLTPTPEEMRNTLRYIIRGSIDPEARLWAASELERIVGVTEWAKYKPKSEDDKQLERAIIDDREAMQDEPPAGL